MPSFNAFHWYTACTEKQFLPPFLRLLSRGATWLSIQDVGAVHSPDISQAAGAFEVPMRVPRWQTKQDGVLVPMPQVAERAAGDAGRALRVLRGRTRSGAGDFPTTFPLLAAPFPLSAPLSFGQPTAAHVWRTPRCRNPLRLSLRHIPNATWTRLHVVFCAHVRVVSAPPRLGNTLAHEDSHAAPEARFRVTQSVMRESSSIVTGSCWFRREAPPAWWACRCRMRCRSRSSPT